MTDTSTREQTDARIRALVEAEKVQPPTPEDLAWQDDLPEEPVLKDDDDTSVTFFQKKPPSV
jgi:hypothetical protein